MFYYVSIRSELRVVKSVMISAYNTMFGSSLHNYVWPYVAGVGEFSLLIKSPNKAWRLIVFATFLIIIITIIIIIIYYYYYYYYYYSSSSSRRELVRTNSERLMFRSLLNFTGRWIPISRGAIRSWNFQNGRRCHGNREDMSKSLTLPILDTAIYIIY